MAIMNHLIFGGSGFIGTHLKLYLGETIENNDNIISYDIDNKYDSNFIYSDVRKSININNTDFSNSIIYNLAAVHITPGHTDNEYFETNVLGAKNICDFAKIN